MVVIIFHKFRKNLCNILAKQKKYICTGQTEDGTDKGCDGQRKNMCLVP